MNIELQTRALTVSKEQVPGIITLNPADVLTADVDKKHRNRMLYLAMILGNGYKSKVQITFETIDGPRRVETTVWATTERNVMLKGGITIPVNSIYLVEY